MECGHFQFDALCVIVPCCDMDCFMKSMAVSVVGISLFAGGCNSSDPSVQEELTRLKAEKAAAEAALAKKDGEIASIKGLHDAEMADLKGKLEMAGKHQPAAVSAAPQMPTPDQVEAKLAMETMKLRRAAEQQLPGYVMKDFSLHDINIPSPETPFQARVTMTMSSPKGETFQLYWQGKGDMMGNWHYEQVKDGFPDSATAAVAPTPRPTPTPQPVSPRNPVPATPAVAVNPAPAAPAAPAAREPEASRPDVSRSGAMPSSQTYIIDPTKQRPMKMGNP